jgi:hypothetical protein
MPSQTWTPVREKENAINNKNIDYPIFFGRIGKRSRVVQGFELLNP